MKSTQCPFIVDFPGTGSNPTVSFPIELSSPPFEGTGRLIFIQDCMGRALGSPRMLRTLLMTSISPRNECPRLTEEGKYSSTDINIIIHDLEAKYHPTHILVVSSSNNPWHMLLYPVHASILGMFCPKLRIGLERSPMDHEKINPALPPGPKEVALRVKQIQLTFPDTLGVLLTYLYTRCQHFIVRQCLPMYTIKGPCGEPTVDLSDEQYAESLGYLIAQGVPYHTLVEYIVKITMLAETAMEMHIVEPMLWPLLNNCYNVMLNALAFTTAGSPWRDLPLRNANELQPGVGMRDGKPVWAR